MMMIKIQNELNLVDYYWKKKKKKKEEREREFQGEKVGKNIYKSIKKYRGLP